MSDHTSWHQRHLASANVFCAVLVLAAVLRLVSTRTSVPPAVSAWTTVFAAICIQASPYLVLGVAVSTVLGVCVPQSYLARVLPSRASIAVPVAGVAGVLLPGCECGSVPVAASLVRRGVAPGAAVTFLLSAPAINPVVLTATAVAFPGQPRMVLARACASLLTAVVTGWCWQYVGRSTPVRVRRIAPDDAPLWQRVRMTASHDVAQAFGLLVIGAASAALVNVAAPPGWLNAAGRHAATGVVVLAALAVVLAVCSEADAFIASSLTSFSPTARLAFMVVGPAVDVKLVAMQAGTFGRRFACRFAPLTMAVACTSAVLVGRLAL